ncbi:Hypothetical_protein [Hexamita inflata]|uniref:Hypothetical_protein n=1 Tax=Hexamita inflata TaxID=28002 RepID=A0AA86PX89_9EUKA|nr:Hypothetical protein HINF_LOCUS34166 [Hexamita inflata]
MKWTGSALSGVYFTRYNIYSQYGSNTIYVLSRVNRYAYYKNSLSNVNLSIILVKPNLSTIMLIQSFISLIVTSSQFIYRSSGVEDYLYNIIYVILQLLLSQEEQ